MGKGAYGEEERKNDEKKKLFLYISEKYCTFANYFAILAKKHIITYE